MSEFVESEAEESEDDEIVPARRRKVEEDEEEEEEEDDDEKLREEMKDLINDEEEEEEEGEDEHSDVEGRKKKRRHDDFDDALEDEDYDLLEENLGVRVQRKKKFKRLRRIEDDEESDAEEARDVSKEPTDDREAIANELFEGSDVQEEERGEVSERADEEEPYGDLGSESEGASEEDDFIVDDDGQPITKGKKRRHVKYTDAALQEAQDIFGVDFDYAEFEQYGDDYDEEIEEDEQYEEEEEEGETRPRPKKSVRKRKARKSIFDVFEPSELERSHFTDKDNEIKATDIPERFQLRSVPVTQAEDNEIEEEAEWIYKQAFGTPTISILDPTEQKDRHQPIAGRKGIAAISKIRAALNFMRNQHYEVPFIAFYKKEYVEPDLNINDLWTVFRWDEKWCQLQTRRNNLSRLFTKMQQYQCDEIMKDPDKPLSDTVRPLEDCDIERLKEVQTFEELRDMYLHFILYYSHDIPGMQEALRKQRKKEADASGKTQDGEDGENQPEPDQDATVVKHAVRRDMYAICRDAGIGGLAKKFGLSPEHFGENLRDNYERHEVDLSTTRGARMHHRARSPICSPQRAIAATWG